MTGFHEARNYALDEAGSQLAFVAERDSAMKAPSKVLSPLVLHARDG